MSQRSITVELPFDRNLSEEHYLPTKHVQCPSCNNAPTPGMAVVKHLGMTAVEYECPNCGEELRVEIDG